MSKKSKLNLPPHSQGTLKLHDVQSYSEKGKKIHISYNVSKLEYTQLLSFNIVYFSPEIMSMIMIIRYNNKLATLEKNDL